MARNFTTQTVGTEFVITEVAPATDVLSPSTSRELAWQRARSQANPVVFVALDGTRRELGDCFDVKVWEQAMYSGHIGYELSMTDGYYAPEGLDRWLHWFRHDYSTRGIDASPETLAALPRYIEMTQALAA